MPAEELCCLGHSLGRALCLPQALRVSKDRFIQCWAPKTQPVSAHGFVTGTTLLPIPQPPGTSVQQEQGIWGVLPCHAVLMAVGRVRCCHHNEGLTPHTALPTAVLKGKARSTVIFWGGERWNSFSLISRNWLHHLARHYLSAIPHGNWAPAQHVSLVFLAQFLTLKVSY